MNPDRRTPPDLCPQTPSLDPERIEMLHELCVDAGPEVFLEVLGSWEMEATKGLAAAEIALRGANAPALKAAAHALKGCCANMGVSRLAELSRALEGAAAEPATAAPLLRAMQSEYCTARDELKKIGQ